jgi:uncharacterized membrane protein YuzA (DUF378 family)
MINYSQLATILISIGSINWALSLHNMNIVDMIPSKQVKTIVYYLIAIAGIYLLVQMLLKKEKYDDPPNFNNTRKLRTTPGGLSTTTTGQVKKIK